VRFGPQKELLPDGGVLWHVFDHGGVLDELAGDPVSCLRPCRQPGDRIWTAGFPTRAWRRSPHYPDADDSLRISAGPVVSQSPGEIRAIVDGVAGSSGSPAFNEAGELVGLFRVHSLYNRGSTAASRPSAVRQ
jgi:hypothetical protein